MSKQQKQIGTTHRKQSHQGECSLDESKTHKNRSNQPRQQNHNKKNSGDASISSQSNPIAAQTQKHLKREQTEDDVRSPHIRKTSSKRPHLHLPIKKWFSVNEERHKKKNRDRNINGIPHEPLHQGSDVFNLGSDTGTSPLPSPNRGRRLAASAEFARCHKEPKNLDLNRLFRALTRDGKSQREGNLQSEGDKSRNHCGTEKEAGYLQDCFDTDNPLQASQVDAILCYFENLGLCIPEDILHRLEDSLLQCSVANVIEHYMVAVKHNLERVMDCLITAIRERFLCVSQTWQFLQLDVEFVELLLSDTYINVNCELDVFCAALRWLDFNKQDRICYAGQVLNSVRYYFIPLADILQYVEPKMLDLFHGSKNAETLVNIYKFHALVLSGQISESEIDC